MRRDLPFPCGDPELMPRARDALVVYEGLPVAEGGAHELGRRDPLVVWRQLQIFLRECAVIDCETATVSLQESLIWFSSRESRAARAELSRRLGHGHRTGAGWGSGRVRDHFWGVDPEQVEATLAWLKELPDLPPVYGSPAVFLGYEARFRLVDLESGRPLPYQGGRFCGNQDFDGLGLMALGESRLFARLCERPSCNLVLSLPYRRVDDELRRYAAELQRRLPFRLSADDWTLWQLDAERSGYRATDVDVLPGESGVRRHCRPGARRPQSPVPRPRKSMAGRLRRRHGTDDAPGG